MSVDPAPVLIVNADDFGLSAGVNRGIVRAHERGIVTSASLMVRHLAAAEAAAYARDHPRLGLGLHVDLGEWVYRGDAWVPVYERVQCGDADAVGAETRDQLDEFRRLTGRGPTHLDTHQHVHLHEPARSVLLELAQEWTLPLRHFSFVRYCGDFYGQTAEGAALPGAISVGALLALLHLLPPGATELGCHPGEVDGLESSYLREREQELEALCDLRVRSAIEEAGIELRSFAEIERRDDG